ncbi:hypothetical protein ACIBHX_46810 [Nonomuraea sp. NPDC050536]|uniref:hypothetical protein n=1 Tax=Nonomuraea sp. NPDC050536 TaxID=3364366 RepID=UPI0037C8E9C5
MPTNLPWHIDVLVRAVTALDEPTIPGPGAALNTEGLADFLRSFFGPLFLVAVGVVALFFLFAREITRFIQFLIVTLAVAVLFYVPNIIEVAAKAIAGALGIGVGQ